MIDQTTLSPLNQIRVFIMKTLNTGIKHEDADMILAAIEAKQLLVAGGNLLAVMDIIKPFVLKETSR